VIETLTLIEQCAARLLQLWQDVEAVETVVSDAQRNDDRRFLNGPKLADDNGHFNQGDIDVMFGCA